MEAWRQCPTGHEAVICGDGGVTHTNRKEYRGFPNNVSGVNFVLHDRFHNDEVLGRQLIPQVMPER